MTLALKACCPSGCRQDCLHREQETGPCNEGANYDSGTAHVFDRNRSWQTSLAGGRIAWHNANPQRPPYTCASWLVRAGVPLPVVQQHLGHENINTTIGLYAHIDRRSIQTAADVIGHALGGC
jgi:integrase